MRRLREDERRASSVNGIDNGENSRRTRKATDEKSDLHCRVFFFIGRLCALALVDSYCSVLLSSLVASDLLPLDLELLNDVLLETTDIVHREPEPVVRQALRLSCYNQDDAGLEQSKGRRECVCVPVQGKLRTWRKVLWKSWRCWSRITFSAYDK